MDNCECAELLQDGCEEIIGVCPESPVVRDYNAFTNKPSINGVTLVGNKTSEDLGITQQITDAVQTEAEARQTADEALQQEIDDEETARTNADTALDGRITANATNIANEALARQQADSGLQSQIDAITSQSDVVDVVANYAALQAYDTSTLSDNDVIKVLDDETHEDALTYYRWSTTTQTWSYIGQEAPYYSKGQMDVMLQGKQDTLTAGANIQIENGTISATDTTYTAGNGLNLNGTEFSADTNVLATKADLEGYYTKPEADNLLAPKLEAEVVTELPTTGTEGKLYLTPKAHTTQTATGNPITATVAEEAGALESFQLDGDTFQQSYEGKNLFDKNAPQAPNARCTGTLSGNTFTITATQANTGYYSIIIPNSSDLLGKTCVISYSAESSVGSGRLRVFATRENAPQNVTVDYADNQGDGSQTVAVTFPSAYPTGSDCFSIVLYSTNQAGSTVIGDNSKYSNIQLEVGSSATSYEPFVGGQPSPSPDYPQPIQTVTGTQTVEIQGKNLLRYPYTGRTVGTGLTWTAADDGTIHVVGTIGGGNKSYYLYNRSQSDFDMPEIPAGTYKVFWSIAGSGSSPRITIQDANGYHNSNASNEVTIATSAKPTNIYIQFTGSQSGDVDLYIKPMIVPSDQADAYAPYSHQTLPLDLGTIELCKLGTYQDYIWKDGDDWKIHKAFSRTDTSEVTSVGSVATAQSGKNRWRLQFDNAKKPLPISGSAITLVFPGYCEGLRRINRSQSYSAVQGIAPTDGSYYYTFVVYAEAIAGLTSEAVIEWLQEKALDIVYVLETPTDTIITDQTLIAQLEAIRTASLQNGANTITNTATGSNLTGDMEIGYYGFAPRNRYDKWLWLDINNEYEQIGS